MKAVIPVAGAGTRLRPHTYTQPKPLIPVAGKSIISFIIDKLVEVGIKDFVFVIGYLGEKIKLYVQKEYPNINMEFVQQNSREGSAHAIWTARKAIEGADEVFIVFGDVIIDVNMEEVLKQETSCVVVKKVDDPREFGVVEYGDDGYVTGESYASAAAQVDVAAFNQSIVMGANVMGNTVDMNVVGGSFNSNYTGDDSDGM